MFHAISHVPVLRHSDISNKSNEIISVPRELPCWYLLRLARGSGVLPHLLLIFAEMPFLTLSR